MITVAQAQQRLRVFAEIEAAAESPLYTHLATAAAQDDEVAALLTAAPPERARATLLLAAAHRLVLADPICELSRYYPSIGGEYGVDSGTWEAFRAFVLDRADKMRELIATRTTQTNEVRRAAVLYPAIAQAAKQAGGPIGLLEVGSSAGLLLGIDRYGYRYLLTGGEQVTAGPAKAPIVLTSTLTVGPKRPALPRKLAVGAKIGLDVHPVDLADEESLAWLEACVWADQPERIRLLNAAAAAQAKDRPELVTGDLVDDLAATAAKIPAELPLVVLSSHVLVYASAQRRAEFVSALAELARTRPLWWVSQEVYEAGLRELLPDRADLAFDGVHPTALLGLTRWVDGRPSATPLARVAPHGESGTWLN